MSLFLPLQTGAGLLYAGAGLFDAPFTSVCRRSESSLLLAQHMCLKPQTNFGQVVELLLVGRVRFHDDEDVDIARRPHILIFLSAFALKFRERIRSCHIPSLGKLAGQRCCKVNEIIIVNL